MTNMPKYPSVKTSLLVVFLFLVLRKIVLALIAMNTVRLSWDQVSTERMLSSIHFNETVASLPAGQETFVLILNKHALNMTFNWLCNTAELPGVHRTSLVVTLDDEAAAEIKKTWPRIAVLEWRVPGLKEPFNYGDGNYQLLYLFRSNLARALLELGRSFWMIQQDTFWAESLSSISIADDLNDIIFDRASEHGLLIAGGYYGAKPTAASKNYFDRLSNDISWWYVPDNAYATSLCQLAGLAKCGQLPFSLITNWQWLDSGSERTPPKFIQFDGETKLGGKLARMKKLGFYFLEEDGRTCNLEAVEEARHNVEERRSSWSETASYSHRNFKLYQTIVDALYSNPATSWLLNRWILPYAHFCMLSL